jgi:hypothetical protein
MSVSSKIIIRFVSAAFFFSVLLSLAGSVQAKNRVPSTKTVVVIGKATIHEDDSANAREKAISNSLVSAMESTVVELLPLESLVQNFQILNEVLYGKTRKFIQGYKVLAEFPSDNYYRVMVEATVSISSLKKLMSRAGILLGTKPMPRILLLISEQYFEDLLPKYWWEKDSAFIKAFSVSSLSKILTTKGFPVIKHKAMARNVRIESVYDKPDLTNQEAINLGTRFNANVVIVGKAVTYIAPNLMGENIRSFKGIVSARAIRTYTGAEIASTMQTAVTTNTDETVGNRDALSSAGTLAGEELATQIAAAWQKEEKQTNMVEIMVEGTGNLANFIKFRRIINNMPGVEGVQIKEMKSDQATIIVDYQGSAKEFADDLMLKTIESIGINIYEVSQNRLRIELIPG